MRTNEATVIVGDLIVLVPYKRFHVPKYHSWMLDPELRTATASEPLTMEEYDMQRSWREDDDKCTFIVVDKPSWIKKLDTVRGMIGDVNLFFNDVETRTLAEIEVMIAEPTKRHGGRGREAVQLMMAYAHRFLGVKGFRAKIGCSNTISLNMFEKLDFREVSRSSVFDEATLECFITESNAAYWTEAGLQLTIQEFPEDLESE